MIPLRLDHLVICAADLGAGADDVATRLGVDLAPGGRHAAMGTHNRLLSLGPDLYLEVIAVDPDAPPPGRARWFGLDGFAGPPRLAAWVAACDDLDAALAAAPAGAGAPLALSRGELSWRMAVAADGGRPFDGVFPALIAWDGAAHPAAMLPDAGCRLRRLTLAHPDAAGLGAALAGLDDARLAVVPGPPGLSAEIDTPGGPVVLA